MDVVFITRAQVIKLWINEKNFFSKYYSLLGTSAMDEHLGKDVLFGRPFGGIGILVKNSLANNCVCLFKDDICIILIYNDLLIINVYMPSCTVPHKGNKDGKKRFLEILESMSKILDGYKLIINVHFFLEVILIVKKKKRMSKFVSWSFVKSTIASGASFQLFLGGQFFLYFSMPPD